MDLCSCVWGKENSEFGNKSMEFSGSSGSFIYTPETQSEIATVIQGILLGLFLLPLLYKSSLRVWVYCRTLGKQQTEAIEKQAEKRAVFGLLEALWMGCLPTKPLYCDHHCIMILLVYLFL
ncbi:uncharacterized protein LOC123407165 isoform X5 [Hordeum vulgare subsp. vulgare]|uniref:uncharacterized protein LOC123407165 isoform X5 n=1 Tax=Hordeum vulgare subsp. vulgare TaxID=112509 RepID=UPI001D1A3F30|nr:uncharacterized protein LOC123407165 isoform X5 [Hordeum vulgare subsp. vulgare]